MSDADPRALPSAGTADRPARAALSRIVEPGDAVIGGLVDAMGAPAVLAAILDGSLPVQRLPHYRARLSVVDPEADLVRGTAQGIRLVCPGDPEWPEQVDDLGARRPLALWVRGEDLRLAAARSVAIVGARACTAYGEHVAAELAAVVAERGWTVVSGAAYGIDAAAHRGALAVAGRTVAVLACGVDVAYPRRHAALLTRIAEVGTVVSELAPGETVTKPRFLERNRVIAALTRGTVVIEAAARSGALSTAGRAAELNRHVMAVPGPVTSSASAGCHRLVRESRASLVTDGADVLDLVGELVLDAAPEVRGETRVHDDLPPDLLQVFEALPTLRGRSIDSIVIRAGLAVPSVLAALAALEDRGLAEAQGDGWRLSRTARQPALLDGGSAPAAEEAATASGRVPG